MFYPAVSGGLAGLWLQGLGSEEVPGVQQQAHEGMYVYVCALCMPVCIFACYPGASYPELGMLLS